MLNQSGNKKLFASFSYAQTNWKMNCKNGNGKRMVSKCWEERDKVMTLFVIELFL